jgi:hypothetical protein
MDASEVAAMLRRPKAWVWEEARCHRLPLRRVGRRLLFVEEEIRRWVDGERELEVLLGGQVVRIAEPGAKR